ncbi:MAG TPA: serine dehydratase subunit alpha family protein [Candidatus Aphodovivens avistercoris]|nr:serine dehydratase subunit alpha family protein [Candidatus Aphodovivens avistercoris]
MDKSDACYGAYIAILEEELIPAMGCTEPIAIALAAARARELAGGLPDRMELEVSGSIVKNAKSVVVPHTGGLKGIEAAAAAGAVAGRADAWLEVLAQVGEAEQDAIAAYLAAAPIAVTRADTNLDFDLTVRAFRTAEGREHSGEVRIAEFHTNIVCEQRDGLVLHEAPLAGATADATRAAGDDATGAAEGAEGTEETKAGDEAAGCEHRTDRSLLTMEGIWDFAMTADLDDVRAVIGRQIACNTAIAEEGLAGDWGANIGSVLLSAFGDDVKVRACALAAAGSDARMGGCELPVVINSGSGNQGLTVSMPVIAYARELGSSEERLYRALVLSNLTAIHQKTGIGTLSAFCGAVCAGAAAAAGIAYLNGGGYKDAVHAVVNALSIVSGIVCDGAKPSCAAKIAMSVNAGILGFEMYRAGQQFHGGDGIVKKGVENTIESVCRVGREGMRATNDEIIRIMLDS